MTEQVILVNENDEVTGVAEKLATHSLGTLHRAFSIFVFNSSGQLLLQKRTRTKYHSKGLWSNTCCGHPRPGESTEGASCRRLLEEMGFGCDLKRIFNFIYYTKLDDGLFEHEYDHVLIGHFDGEPDPSPDEVDDWRWVDLSMLQLEMQANPEDFTYWFKLCFSRLRSHIASPNSLSLPGTNKSISECLIMK